VCGLPDCGSSLSAAFRTCGTWTREDRCGCLFACWVDRGYGDGCFGYPDALGDWGDALLGGTIWGLLLKVGEREGRKAGGRQRGGLGMDSYLGRSWEY
jgi:hypothetical protein